MLSVLNDRVASTSPFIEIGLYNNFTSFVLLHSLCYVLPFDPVWVDGPAGSCYVNKFRHGLRESAARGKGMIVPLANPVTLGEADIRPVVAYPYQEDEMIGEHSVLDIRTRLLRSKAQPSAEEINLAHINAQDRFEVKVDIIQQMVVLDSEPSGDWFFRDGEDELHEGGVQSDAFLSGKALQSEVLRLGEEMFLVDAGPGTAIICMQDEPTGVPINRATRLEKKVGSLDLVAGESLIKKKILERLFIDLVASESLIKERAAVRFNDLVGSTNVVAGEPLLLLPRRFRQNRAWMELKKIWRTNTKVKGFIIKKSKRRLFSSHRGFHYFYSKHGQQVSSTFQTQPPRVLTLPKFGHQEFKPH
ncbi:hypothetical protein Lal_00042326 [Lupinus albus]|nr:hypothetical protein Lal_00042326 [Lupinus albus]